MMDNKRVISAGLILLCAAGFCRAATASDNSVDDVLKELSKKAAAIKSYRCQIDYLYSQPLFESKTLRKGRLYYHKCEGGSALRINFKTLKQDDEPEQKYFEQYIFDGVWLTVIDYQLKEVKRYQQAEVNEPMDAFELARRNLPIVGFSETENLKKDFEITLLKPGRGEAGKFSHHLRLKTKADSRYKDDYTTIDFWIDKKSGLTAKIVAVSTQDDVYQINLAGAAVNNKIDKKVFEVVIPKGFNESESVGLDKGKK